MARVGFQALFVAACAAFAHATPAKDWDRVDITWPKFSTLPITEDAAITSKWDKVDQVDGCVARYSYGADPSTFVLFDINRRFAGIQVGTQNGKQNGGVYPNGPWQQEVVNGATLYTITAYTRDPLHLCQTNSTAPVVGEGLWFQHGPFSAKDFHTVPLTEADAKTTLWQRGKCFITMGSHYWYNFSNDTPCDSTYPIFLLYNRGILNAWGWSLTNLPQEQGGRWEHPSGEVLKLFLDPSRQPKCLFDQGRVLSTQHIYFSQPAFDFC